MDLDGLKSIQLLNSIAESVDMLHKHGYKLYLDTHAESWTNRRNITVSAEPFSFIFGNAIQPTLAYAIIFGIRVSWHENTWKIVADIERETYGKEYALDTLWEQEYGTTDIDTFVDLLRQATIDLIQETSSEWFYAKTKATE